MCTVIYMQYLSVPHRVLQDSEDSSGILQDYTMILLILSSRTKILSSPQDSWGLHNIQPSITYLSTSCKVTGRQWGWALIVICCWWPHLLFVGGGGPTLRSLLSPTDSCGIPEDSCTIPGLSIGWCASQFFQSCGGIFLRTKDSPEDCQTGPVQGLMYMRWVTWQINMCLDISCDMIHPHAHVCLSYVTHHISLFNCHHHHRSPPPTHNDSHCCWQQRCWWRRWWWQCWQCQQQWPMSTMEMATVMVPNKWHHHQTADVACPSGCSMLTAAFQTMNTCDCRTPWWRTTTPPMTTTIPHPWTMISANQEWPSTHERWPPTKGWQLPMDDENCPPMDNDCPQTPPTINDDHHPPMMRRLVHAERG